MSVRCKQVQQALAADSAREIEVDALIERHLEECDECLELEAALAIVDDSLAAMPAINPPSDLVDRVLEEAGSNAPAIALVHSGPGDVDAAKETSPAPASETRLGRTLAIGGAFAAAAAVLLVSLNSLVGSGQSASESERRSKSVVAGAVLTPPVAASQPTPADPNEPDDGPAFAGDTTTFGVEVDGRFRDHRRGPASGEDKAGNVRVRGLLSGKGKGLDNGEHGLRIQQGQMGKPLITSAPDVAKIDLVEQEKSVDNERAAAVNGLPKQDELNGKKLGDTYQRNVPVPGRTFEGTLSAAAGSSGDDRGVTVSGSTKLENTYRVDGAFKTKREPAGKDSRDGDGDGWAGLQFSLDGPTDYYKYTETDNKPTDALRWRQRGEGRKRAKLAEEITKRPDETKAVKAGQKLPSEKRDKVTLATGAAASGQARAFVEQRSTYAGIATVGANGFWSNNYIPGDPRLRLLAARLRQDPSARRIGALDAAVAPYSQSFDAPKNSALAVTVRSDRRASDGPARMLLQVGLKGTARQGGGRPALNVGVVLDLGNANDDAAAAMRSLLTALRSAKRRGDRFSLTVANRPGGLMLTPEQFRNGPLRVAMQSLFAGEASNRPTLSLADAISVATAQVAATDDPNGPLGRSMVLVVTAKSASSAVDRKLLGLAHAIATQGIALSTIGVGTAVDDQQLLRWAAAGHGNRRLLVRASDANKVIASELASAEAVVARAVRVRVKLANGVKLVEVVGSKRLGAAASKRTREAEKSIDRRVAKARGITSDREQDEDGIKIIIPSFSAGDSHVILLDVIADGPGAVADVAVTYKDLVHLRNGSARSTLSLQTGRDGVGQLERSVFKNYVGLVISQRLANAGTLLASNDVEGAATVVSQLQDLLQGLRSLRPWLRKDRAFARDLAVVSKYSRVLSRGVTDRSKAYVANSLSYAAWRKIVRVRRESK